MLLLLRQTKRLSDQVIDVESCINQVEMATIHYMTEFPYSILACKDIKEDDLPITVLLSAPNGTQFADVLTHSDAVKVNIINYAPTDNVTIEINSNVVNINMTSNLRKELPLKYAHTVVSDITKDFKKLVEASDRKDMIPSSASPIESVPDPVTSRNEIDSGHQLMAIPSLDNPTDPAKSIPDDAVKDLDNAISVAPEGIRDDKPKIENPEKPADDISSIGELNQAPIISYVPVTVTLPSLSESQTNGSDAPKIMSDVESLQNLTIPTDELLSTISVSDGVVKDLVIAEAKAVPGNLAAGIPLMDNTEKSVVETGLIGDLNLTAGISILKPAPVVMTVPSTLDIPTDGSGSDASKLITDADATISVSDGAVKDMVTVSAAVPENIAAGIPLKDIPEKSVVDTGSIGGLNLTSDGSILNPAPVVVTVPSASDIPTEGSGSDVSKLITDADATISVSDGAVKDMVTVPAAVPENVSAGIPLKDISETSIVDTGLGGNLNLASDGSILNSAPVVVTVTSTLDIPTDSSGSEASKTMADAETTISVSDDVVKDLVTAAIPEDLAKNLPTEEIPQKSGNGTSLIEDLGAFLLNPVPVIVTIPSTLDIQVGGSTFNNGNIASTIQTAPKENLTNTVADTGLIGNLSLSPVVAIINSVQNSTSSIPTTNSSVSSVPLPKIVSPTDDTASAKPLSGDLVKDLANTTVGILEDVINSVNVGSTTSSSQSTIESSPAIQVVSPGILGSLNLAPIAAVLDSVTSDTSDSQHSPITPISVPVPSTTTALPPKATTVQAATTTVKTVTTTTTKTATTTTTKTTLLGSVVNVLHLG